MLVGQTQLGQHVPNYEASVSPYCTSFYVPTKDKPTPIEDPHCVVSVCFLCLRRSDATFP